MIETQVLDYDPLLKRTRKMHYDPLNDNFIIESVHDVQDILDANSAKRALTDERSRWGEVTQVASIPMHLYYQWKKDGVIDVDGKVEDDESVARVLNDNTFSKLRTRHGRI
jgi:hypothetical protein